MIEDNPRPYRGLHSLIVYTVWIGIGLRIYGAKGKSEEKRLYLLFGLPLIDPSRNPQSRFQTQPSSGYNFC